MKRYFVGKKHNSIARVVFASDSTPTQATHGDRFSSVDRTVRGIEMKALKAGIRVIFTKKSGRIDPSVHVIESSEVHDGRLFYRLRGFSGSLFARESLATTKRKAIDNA